MLRQTIALLALLVLPTSAQALELGVQDDGRTTSAVTQDTNAIGGSWTRTTAYIGQAGVAHRIRDAHKAGQKIILTVGGTGTRTKRPSFTKALRYIHKLPRADKYTIYNEPDLGPHGRYGINPCRYRKSWLSANRVLKGRLLWGDLSPHAPLGFTAAARRCGSLPRTLDMAVHPYCSTDPLKHCDAEGGLGNLGQMKMWLKINVGVKVNWWLTEFGYMQGKGNSDWRISDAEAAWMWPRAVKQAKRQHARVLIAYTAQGPTWDTRPRPLAWCSLTRGRACPGAERPDEHRYPRHLDPVVLEMLDYTSA